MGEGVGGGALPCPRDVRAVWVARQGPRDTFSGKREAVPGPSDDKIATQRTVPTRATTTPNAFLSSRAQPSEPTISEPRGGWGGAGGSSRNPALRTPTWQYGVGATSCYSDRPSGCHGLERVARSLRAGSHAPHSPGQLCPPGHQTCLQSRGRSPPGSSAWRVSTGTRGRRPTATGCGGGW